MLKKWTSGTYLGQENAFLEKMKFILKNKVELAFIDYAMPRAMRLVNQDFRYPFLLNARELSLGLVLLLDFDRVEVVLRTKMIVIYGYS